jgi:putative ABC transport system ATP-binding protein
MSIIELKDVSKVYSAGETELRALDGVSISFEMGEMTAIMGASGSGKSTLMNIIGCLDNPTTGSYHLEGVDVGRMKSDELAVVRNEKIGFVFQAFNLLPRTTAFENVELPLIYRGMGHEERVAHAAGALEAVGLGNRAQSLPNQLSGGQQQRVAIARAIANRAPILLADEPTGNLDTHSSTEIMEIFTALNRDKRITILLVTHEPDIAEYARRIVRFKDGRIVEDRKR